MATAPYDSNHLEMTAFVARFFFTSRIFRKISRFQTQTPYYISFESHLIFANMLEFCERNPQNLLVFRGFMSDGTHLSPVYLCTVL